MSACRFALTVMIVSIVYAFDEEEDQLPKIIRKSSNRHQVLSEIWY